MSVERLELSKNGLKGQIGENAVGNQGLTVLCQSIGWVEEKVHWLPWVTFFKVQSTLCRPMDLFYIFR